MLLPAIFFYEKGSDIAPKKYNQDMSVVAKNIVDFIQLHYFTERSDTEFWRWCKNEMAITDFNKDYLDYFKNHMPHPHYFNHPMQLFTQLSYTQVMHGLRMFNTEKIKEKYESQMHKYIEINNEIMRENTQYTDNVETWPHRVCLEKIKERYESLQYKF
jgi:hypothetical protein